VIRAHKLTARPLTARKLIAYKLGQQSSSFDPIRLFSAGEDGTWLDFTTTQVYADTAGTDPAEVGEGIAFVDDKSPNNTDALQTTSTARPIFGRVPVSGRRNLLERTEEFDNAVWLPGRSDSADVAQNEIDIYGNANSAWTVSDPGPELDNLRSNITVSGIATYRYSIFIKKTSGATTFPLLALTATGGTLVSSQYYFDTNNGTIFTRSGAPGTGGSVQNYSSDYWRVSWDVTTNGTNTGISTNVYPAVTTATDGTGFAPSLAGSIVVFGPQLEVAAAPTPYQKVVTQHDITEAGVPSVYKSFFDKSDDILPVTLPTITGGTVALVGTSGIWIEDDWDFTAGTLSIGPTTIAGLPAGILSVVGDLCAVIINDRAWSAAERAGVIAWGKARGAPGVFAVSDTELVTNGDFSDGSTGWTTEASWSISGGELVVTQTGSVVGCSQTFAVTAGDKYFVEMECTSYTSGVCAIGTKTGLPQEAFKLSAASVGRGVITAGAANDGIRIVSTGAGFFGSLDNISVRKLELIP
jgi:hypothetical protein